MKRRGLRAWISLPLSRKATRDREVDAEIEFHIESRAKLLEREGMGADDARAEARRRFGGDEFRESLHRDAGHREVRLSIAEWIADVSRDASFAIRGLRRRWAFASTAILTLALGIGAATTAFTVVNGVLLRPLPYADPDRLVTLYTVFPHWKGQPGLGAEWNTMRTPYPDFVRFRANQRSFTSVAALDVGTMSFSDRGEAEMIQVGRTTPELLPLLGISISRGRWFTKEEEGTNSSPVVVLGESMWRTRFGGAEDVIGKTIFLNEKAFRVIGILPRGFDFTRSASTGLTARAALWIPLGSDGTVFFPHSFDLEVVGRLVRGHTPEGSLAESERLLRGDDDPAKRALRIVRRADVEVGQLRKPLFVLGAAVCLLLLITCTNVASLFLGEMSVRDAELRTRLALGASRRRLVRLMAVESGLIAFASGAIGLAMGWAGTSLLVSRAPLSLPHEDVLRFDPAVVAFVVGVAAACAAICGVAPALVATANVRTGTQRVTRSGRAQLGIIAFQAALSVILLGGAGLLARSLANQSSVDAGFATDHLLTMRVYLPRTVASKEEDRRAAYDGVARRLGQLPGVLAVTANSNPPLAGRTSNLAISTNPSSDLTSASPTAERDVVFPNYFAMMGIRLVAGRGFSSMDVAGSERVAVVTQAMVDRFWPGESVIGREFRHPSGIATIVGVVTDVRNKSLDQPAGAKYYVPFHQEGARLSFMLRTRDAPASLIPAAQQAIWRLVPGSTMAEVETMDAMIDADLAPERYRALLAGAFAFAALLITAVGVSGLIARGIAARMKELCVRMALGSTPAAALANGVRGTIGAVVAGVVAGLAASPIALSLLQSYLYQVSSWDPPTLGVATAAMIGVALAAAVLASRRLLTADLVTVLRGE